MIKITNSKHHNLEERTYNFTKEVKCYLRNLPKSVTEFEIIKQLIRSSGSVGANYIEANEALSKKDFVMRIKICKKEAKESIYWLKLFEPAKENASNKNRLIIEATELMKIFGSILEKSK